MDSHSWALTPRKSEPYLHICRTAATSDMFYKFKSNHVYKNILEHTSVKTAENYVDEIAESNLSNILFSPQLLIDVKKNDIYGSAYLHDFYQIGTMSPSTVKYVYTLYRVLRAFDDLKTGCNICEIGGGYGGLAHVYMSWASYQGRRCHYTIYDLSEPVMLQHRYLRALGWKDNVTSQILRDENHDCDVVVSTVALSELTAETQMMYARKLMSKARIGSYLDMNIFAQSKIQPWALLLRNDGFALHSELSSKKGQRCSIVVAKRYAADTGMKCHKVSYI